MDPSSGSGAPPFEWMIGRSAADTGGAPPWLIGRLVRRSASTADEVGETGARRGGSTADAPACIVDPVYCAMWSELALQTVASPQHGRPPGGRSSRRRGAAPGDPLEVLHALRCFVVVSIQPGSGVELQELAARGPTHRFVGSELAATLLRCGDSFSLGLDPTSAEEEAQRSLRFLPPRRMIELWLWTRTGRDAPTARGGRPFDDQKCQGNFAKSRRRFSRNASRPSCASSVP
ncbi:MAG: hypothetical protein DWQ36_10430 [Acidobacteria bacterium]|nr:MAG: hypothetical protein DWQ30_23095 [Acidobacteriota bacterium]REK07917.1 MAG: hypothetical protein DWQ36_10430 [Acidobacteriota bacterium]